MRGCARKHVHVRQRTDPIRPRSLLWPLTIRRQAETWRTGMLETIAVILLILWVLGLFSAYTMGGLIHVLLVIAVVVLLFRVFKGRRIL